MEDYKKKYEEIYERISNLVRDYDCVSGLIDVREELKSILNESQEDKDERIRKEILEYFHQFENEELRRVNISDWIAWLEKQDPKKHEEELEKAYKTADEVQYRKWYEDAKREFEKQGEQKPAWSEEDDDNIMMIEDRLSDYLDYIREDSTLTKHQKNCLKEKVIGYVNWLKSIKERVQPKQEWSEEDEEMFDAIIADIQFTQKAHTHEVNQVVYEREIDWFKSLKERMKGE